MYNETVTNKILNYFIQKLNIKPANGSWFSGTCPECYTKKKFGVSFKQGRTNCFKCGSLGHPLKLLMKLENLDTLEQAKTFISAFEGTSYLSGLKTYTLQLAEVEKTEVGPISLPDGYKILSIGDTFIAKLARKVMKRRGFNILTLSLKGVGYVDTPGPYFAYLIIPYYAQGQIVYFTARKLVDIGPKFKNPNIEDFNIGKSTLTYNSDALAIYSKVQIVESATNSLTLGDRAIGIGGKSLSNSQKSAILRSPVERVEVMLDNDALIEAYKLALALAPHKRVKVVEFPPEQDVNDIGKKASLELSKKTPYLDYSKLLIKLNQLNEKNSIYTPT